jgi:tRNA(Ile)-lysidine synthase
VTRAEALEALKEAVRASGLIEPGCSVVVMTSGGPDSACAAAGVAELIGAGDTHALHVNYSLRETADRDERVCRELCAKLRIDLHVERPTLGGGNLQAAAREARYAAAERLRRRTHSDLVVTGHTRTDLAETVIYRLAVSPGSRAMLGLAPQSGRVVRPLLALERARTRELAEEARLPFADDETNLDPAFARNRIRGEVLPVLRELSPAAERNLAETRMEMAEEARLLDHVILRELEVHGAGAGAVSVSAHALEGWDPALRRLALRALAERAAGRSVPLGRDRAVEISRLAADPEGGEIELGGGLRAICESGLVRFVTAVEVEAAPEPVSLRVPGSAQLGRWEVRAELHPAPVEPSGPELATLDATAVSGVVEVRTWRQGDRIRPLGMEGTKTLQDLFTDRGVPRTVRRDLPVVTVDGAIAWVAGVAVSEDFRLTPTADAAAVLSARVLE